MILENKNNLLSDTEAAYYLGITKELLFAYVQNAPKKHKGENQKLNSVPPPHPTFERQINSLMVA